MAKNPIVLANQMNSEEIIDIQNRVDNNSNLINEMTDKLVADYCRSLDAYVKFIQNILQNEENPPTPEELDDFAMNLPIHLYFCGEAQEHLGIKTDVAKAIRQEKYNEIYSQVSGTIADKTSASELQVQAETITHIIYDRAYKIIKCKLEAAYELLNSVKKVISRRMTELELGKVDSGRFRNGSDSY